MADKITVVAAVVRKNGKLLLTSRPVDKPPHGLEFPGGKIDPGETPAQALRRELREELDVDSIIFDPIYKISTPKIDLWFIRAGIPDGETIRCCEGQDFFWVNTNNKEEVDKLFSQIPLLPNDEKFWHFLCGN